MLTPQDGRYTHEAVYKTGAVAFRVLPYVEATGGCPYLGESDGPGHCTIHATRPMYCRVFNCRSALQPDGAPGEFLRENPRVYDLLRQVDGGTPVAVPSLDPLPAPPGPGD